MTLWILAFEPKCRSAIPSIVSPLCTEYANVSPDVGLALRLGFATLVLGIDLGAADASSTTRLLASPSFGPDEGGIGAAVPSGEAPVCESVGMWDTALTLASRFCATFAAYKRRVRLAAKHKLDFGRLPDAKKTQAGQGG